MPRPRLRYLLPATLVALAALLTAGVVVVRAITSDEGDELLKDRDFAYAAPVWENDGWIYLRRTGTDSESVGELWRVRPHTREQPVDVRYPDCPQRPPVQDLFAISDDTLGLVVSCSATNRDERTLMAYEPRTATASVLGVLPDDVYGIAWDAANKRGYGRSDDCGDGGGLVEFGAGSSSCVLGNGALFPVVDDAAGALFYVGRHCGTAQPGQVLCRWDRHAGAFRIVASGFADVTGAALHASSATIVLAGRRAGKGGLWAVDVRTGSVRRIAEQALTDPAVSPDGRYVATTDSSQNLIGDTYRLVVVRMR
jgi:hypothetical protein